MFHIHLDRDRVRRSANFHHYLYDTKRAKNEDNAHGVGELRKNDRSRRELKVSSCSARNDCNKPEKCRVAIIDRCYKYHGRVRHTKVQQASSTQAVPLFTGICIFCTTATSMAPTDHELDRGKSDLAGKKSFLRGTESRLVLQFYQMGYLVRNFLEDFIPKVLHGSQKNKRPRWKECS